MSGLVRCREPGCSTLVEPQRVRCRYHASLVAARGLLRRAEAAPAACSAARGQARRATRSRSAEHAAGDGLAGQNFHPPATERKAS